ncbi:MAG: lamin tail domain-containing protein [Pirellulales bacterium]|nr:lamin tail domain-containing protein [Pirellulales bacterium]
MLRTLKSKANRARQTLLSPRRTDARLKRRPTLETLESRLVLDGTTPLISEFMAINEGGLVDEDGDFSDWIEIHNPDASALDLEGWYLTDDANDLAKWRFPAVSIDAGDYLVVFASNKNRPDPAELHTNFELNGDGEYLALVASDGTTVAHHFTPEFPQQYKNISYGITQEVTTLVAEGAEFSYLVPSAGDATANWTAPGYNDSAWPDTVTVGASGVVITEIDCGSPEWLEIQNVSDRSINTSGWFVAVNNASSGNINAVNPVVWNLPSQVAAGEILYKTDSASDHYWGGPISWDQDHGWAMVVDNGGSVVDFLPWGYDEAEIAALNVSVNGLNNITVGDRWTGPAPSLAISGWNTGNPGDDIGGPTPGSDSYNPATGVTTIQGNGSDIWGNSDSFRFVHQTHSGDTEVIAKVISVQNTDSWAKAGVMIRDSMAPDSAHAMAVVTPGNGVSFQRRTVTSGGSSHTPGPSVQAPYWVRLVRQGNTVTAYSSPDGSSWSQIGSDTISFSGDVEIGIMVTSHSGGVLCTAEFENVSVGNLVNGTALQRVGGADDNAATNFRATETPNKGSQNPALNVPFFDGDVRPATTGVGFRTDPANFEVTCYQANVAVDSLAKAEEVIDTPALQSSVSAARAEVINYYNIGSDGHYAGNSAFPGLTLYGNVDDFVIEATGTVIIPAPGYWTFGVSSDEGFSLELDNGVDDYGASYPGLRSAGDTLATFHIDQPGAYNLRLISFERSLGAELELFAARGSYSSFNADVFDLVGDTASGGLAVTGFGGAIQTDVAAEMSGVNASLWTRIPFEVDDPTTLDTLTLRIKYNDGFVAYLNGQLVAQRNAPVLPAWNSAASSERPYEDSSAFEQINLSALIGNLVAGTNLLAIHGLNVSAGDDDFLILPELTTTKIDKVQRFFDEPTPQGPNGAGFIDFVGDTGFSVDRGFFSSPFQVAIHSDTPGATIRYTTDGSEPTEATGVEYTGPLTISSTTTLRAAAFKEGYHPTNVDTQTYVFLGDVMAQSPTGGAPVGWPSGAINGQVFDYGMDPDIVNNPTWGPQLDAALTAIPTISLVTDLDNLFDSTSGIYVNASQDGIEWERPTSVELISPDGGQGFQIDAGLRIRGSESTIGSNPKHALRLFFRDAYGQAKLEYPLFGDEGVDVFDKIDLRTAQDPSWSHTGSSSSTMVRDVFARDTQRDMDQPYTRSRYCHLYLNGQYWGLYQTQERSDASFGESYLGGNRGEYDVIKVEPDAGYTIVATDGDLAAWQSLWNQADAGLATDAAYYRAQGLNADGTRNPAYDVLLDVDNLIDYMLVIFYTGDADSPISELLGNSHPNNWYGVRNRTGEEGFQFFIQDAEHTLSQGSEDRTGPFTTGDQFEKSNPQWLHQQLMANAEYRLRFADRAHECLLNDGLLTSTASTERLQARADEIAVAIIAESARWGDAQTAAPLDKADWQAAIDGELGGFFPTRSQTVLNQFEMTTLPGGTPAPLYPSVVAPSYNQHGGQVASGFSLFINAPAGVIYYTLDGSDPRLPGGGVSPNADVFSVFPISITGSTVVKARAMVAGEWSALNQATFFVGQPAVGGDVAITELNYNPYDPTADELAADPTFNNDDFEFIELQNTTNHAIDLTGLRFTTGVQFDFGVDNLAAGQSLVLISNPAAFAARYGTGIHVAGQYTGNLDNDGERIVLQDRNGVAIHDFSYGDSGKWPGRADGKGSALEVLNTAGNYSDDDNWRSSSEYGGSPGHPGTGPVVDVVVNEVLSRPPAGDVDAIELYNASAATVNIAGWYLSDSSDDYRKFRIPDGPEAILAPGEFLVFDESDFNAGGPGAFQLDGSLGDDVWLLEADIFGNLIRFADHVEFGEALDGVSFGRAPDGTGPFGMMSQETIGGPNSSPRVGAIVINELHVRPDVKTEPVEYLELVNTSGVEIDLSGWYFSDGIGYTFPAGTAVAPGGYVVVAQNPTAAQAKFGGTLPLGPFEGKLSNESDRLVLRDAAGVKQDEVDYQLGFPWPTVGDAPGYSMELINPGLDNNLAGSWRASAGSASNEDMLFVEHSTWRYFKGTQEPSAQGDWREPGFDDSGWSIGTGAVGYSTEGDELAVIRTTLSDMRGEYTTVYFRKEFTVDDPAAYAGLLFEARYDDGINFWINGHYIDGANVSGQELPYSATSSGAIDNVEFVPFTLSNPASFLRAGTNVIAVQLFNASISSSSDAFFDGQLRSTTGGEAGLTPGRVNSVFAANAPPQMRQLEHSPEQPASGQEVTVTVKVTDPDGVADVALAYQLVEPGDYISINDARYENPVYWTRVAMYDDGTHGDAFAGDDVYTVSLPGSLQTNRRLVRYRVTVEDTLGASVTAPYADDPQPNFAYYVYDGVPSWTGSAQPGEEPEVAYDSELLTSLPVYTLITQRQDRLNAMSVPYRWGEADQQTPNTGSYGGSDYLWQGALVYDGVVYDHIRYRARGGVWRYSMGKNMYKFDFNRGHYFQARDDYGNKYETQWDKLNFSALIQQGNFGQRGEQGLFEWAGFKLHNLAGNEASNCNFLHFRVVDDGNEGGPDQFSTDFRGLYMTIEQPDGHLLEEHGLPDGNFYKMEGGTGTLNNQGPTQPSNRSDLDAFMSAYESGAMTAQWWRDNFDLDSYYDFRAIAMAIHDYDIHAGKNYFYYHNPETGKWSIHNWDLDLCWTTTYGGGGGGEPFRDRVLQAFPEFRIEYNNRMREIIDLLFNPEQTGMLLDECAQFIYTPGEASFVDADRAMWDYNPILVSSYINPDKAGHGRYYQAAASRDFAGMLQFEKNYVAARISGDTTDPTIASDSSQAPNAPTLDYTGQDGYPVDGLRFRSGTFSSPLGASFSAMQWRIARVTDPTSPDFDPSQPRHYEITATWQSDELTSFDDTITIPGGDIEVGKTYRVRVRMKDSNGRFSHWSEPVQFVAGGAVGPLADGLRITEINYAPYEPTAAEAAAGYESEDFEFVELQNTTGRTLDLGGVRFTNGIDFTFADGTELDPGAHVVVVSNPAAFFTRYGAGANLAGSYSGRLRNEGEDIEVLDPFERVVHDFAYAPDGAWPGRANGKGSSLEIVDPAGDYDNSENWRASTEYGGSPGAAGMGPVRDVVINEVLSHTDAPLSDAIELRNTTGGSIDVGGWYLSDSSEQYRKFRIPDGTSVPAGGYLVFDEDDFNPTPLDPGPNDFSLDGAHGDDVWLLATDIFGDFTRFADHLEFGAAGNGESFGRWPNGTGELYPMAAPTLNPAEGDNSGPRVGPVVISEVHYNPGNQPGDQDFEFLEIFNPTAASVDLTDWLIRKGIEYDFADGAALAAGSTLVVVSFDPADADRLEAFRTYYGIDATVPLFGPYSGQLSNGGEQVQLQDPDLPPAEEPLFIPRLLEDEVVYSDGGSWPAEADGGGASLNRSALDAWGNDAASWVPDLPTPGTAPLLQTASGVVGRYVFYNQSVFDGNNAGADASDDNAIATDKQALLPGQTATFANYTSYSRGINGIMVDIVGVTDPMALDAADFQFRVGNSDNPGTWGAASAPSTVSVRSGAGNNGADRVTIVWPNFAVSKQWLQVTVLANADTGLSEPDVFYFGNSPGEAGNSTADAKVNASDMLLARNNPRNFLNPAPVDFNYDYNHDARVNATDMLIARNNQTHFLNALRLITVPGGKVAESKAAGADKSRHAGLPPQAEIEVLQDDPGAHAKLTWLYEFEQTIAKDRSSAKDNSGKDVMDALWSTDWE